MSSGVAFLNESSVNVNVDVPSILIHRGQYITVNMVFADGKITPIELHVTESGVARILVRDSDRSDIFIGDYKEVYK